MYFPSIVQYIHDSIPRELWWGGRPSLCRSRQVDRSHDDSGRAVSLGIDPRLVYKLSAEENE